MSNFTSVPDKNVGDVFTQSMWATYIEKNLNLGVMRPLADVLLGSSAAQIDFSAIPQTFAHLKLVAYLIGDAAAVAVNPLLRINGDSGANYDQQALFVQNATATASQTLAGTSILIGTMPAATGYASPAMFDIEISQYAVAQRKSLHCRGAARWGLTSTTIEQDLIAGYWRTAAAVTELTLLANSGNFAAGSRATLYGLPF